MSTIDTDVLEAFQSIGIKPEAATRAAAAIHRQAASTSGRVDKVESTLRLHTWMLGFVFAGVASLVIKTFLH